MRCVLQEDGWWVGDDRMLQVNIKPPVYCETCRWCRPAERPFLWPLLSLFGSKREYGLHFAKCDHPHATIPARERFTYLGQKPEPAVQYYCSTQNPRGECPDWEARPK